MRTWQPLLLALVTLFPALAARAGETPRPADVDRLVAELDGAHEQTRHLARVLGTLAGRATLDEAVTEALDRRRLQDVRDALRDVVSSLQGDDLTEPLREWAEDVDLLQGTVADIGRNLVGADVLTSDLRAFLAREDAARVLNRVLVRPRHRPHGLQVALARCLTSDDAGRLHVPSALRERAERVLQSDRDVKRALVRLAEAAPDLRKKIRGEEPWRRALAALLEDELGFTVLLHAAGAWKGDTEETVDQTVERLIALLSEEGSRPPLSFLARARNLRRSAPEALRLARAYAARLDDDSALDAWRALLGSPEALFLSPGGRMERGKAVDVLLDRTGFGRALVTSDDGTVRVNPHARWDLDRILDALRADALEAAVADAAVVGSTLPQTWASPVGRDLLREIATWEAKRHAVEPLAAWIDEVLEAGPEGLCVRAGAGALLDALLARVPEVEREFDSTVSVSLDPASLTWQADALDLLRSSIFYNPRTGYGHRAYVTQFEDHHAARLFGTFGWSAKVSKDLADFKKRIRARKEGLQRLAKTHDKLIVHISGVPPWLSSWEGTGTFEGGGWEDEQAHLPKDLDVWREMIRELALVFREVEGVERYYEFWNEPDLEYWQGSLEEFLALYEATATTVREFDPEGRVGGCAVNQWDGKIHRKRGSDVLVHELIRFAAKRRLPLDFVSWHHFGRPVSAIAEAKASYAAELAKHGFDENVEFLVTEWPAPGRGAPYGNVFFAETMLGFFRAQVDAQTASCWEEFHAQPDPQGFPPWGLMTQQGEKHGTWYVHRFFDRLVRGSRGVTVVREEAGPVVVVSRKDAGVYDLLVWRTGTPPRVKAAWDVLQEAGFGRKDGRVYGTLDRFERALRDGGPAEERWEEAFAAAAEAYEAAGPVTERLLLEIEGAVSVEVLFAESARTEHAVKRVAALKNALTCPLERYEVLHLTIRLRGRAGGD